MEDVPPPRIVNVPGGVLKEFRHTDTELGRVVEEKAPLFRQEPGDWHGLPGRIPCIGNGLDPALHVPGLGQRPWVENNIPFGSVRVRTPVYIVVGFVKDALWNRLQRGRRLPPHPLLQHPKNVGTKIPSGHEIFLPNFFIRFGMLR
ncbi:hypothetical protein, unlikely [Trypanosoma congolense IL3000]|uniref:Uncharacterized protein n=1 Tax=Trypanosoma congolense (strain IL3000) TaxID=1068625 RepID=F9W479_TRYCI|nr:hypothetical protein, unlikely [Trypanosoma congolense IL3000]